jgi:hypothetical protein
MNYRKIGAIVLTVIVIITGNYMIQSFMSYADEVSLEYISQLSERLKSTETRKFEDVKDLIDYYDQLFKEIEFQADMEVDVLVTSIYESYADMDEDERDSPINQAKLASEFVLKAKNYEGFIEDIIEHYLSEMEEELTLQGYSLNTSETIVSQYRKDSVDIWQHNLIVDALDNMTEEEQLQ